MPKIIARILIRIAVINGFDNTILLGGIIYERI